MNMLQTFAVQPWVQRLGLTLLHFLWEGAILAGVYAAVKKWTAGTSLPHGRYVLACGALVAMAICPVVTWMLLREPAAESVAVTFNAPLSAARVQPVRPTSLLLPDEAAPAPLLAWVVAFWLIGAAIFSVRLLANWTLAERLRYKMVHPAPVHWQRTCDGLKARLAVSRPVRLLVSGLLDAPAAIGWLRPLVLVPAGALAGLPSAQMEALLLHELAHIRRHDYLVQILQSTLEAVFFYHPAVWWISRHVREERELCCDDLAVSITGDPVSYALALAEFASARWTGSPAVAANGGSLAHRIARLLGQPAFVHRSSRPPATAPLLFLLAIGAWVLLAQPAALPQFEVDSVKPSLSDRIMSVRPLPGRLTADATLQVLTQYAYGVQPYQVAGGPQWLRSERFQIEAKAATNVSRDQVFLMLQSLLQNRFRLQIHRETRELPVFALVPAKSGLRLSPPKDDTCVDSPAEAASEWAGGRMSPPGGVPAKSRCGSAGVALVPAGAKLHGEKIAMPELARALGLLLDRSVIDQTGFTGLFDLNLDFAPDEATPAMPPPPPGAAISGASLPQALQQQVGLRLESTRGPVSVIVVDRAERPTAN